MTDDKPQTAEEFLRVWRVLAEADNTARLEEWERHLPELAESKPDIALEIVRRLSTSDTDGAKEAAAIYARFIFHARREETTDLLITLYEHSDTETKSRLLDTIDVITSDKNLTAIQAAQLITEIEPQAS